MLADRRGDGSFGGGRVDRTALAAIALRPCVRECLHLQDRYREADKEVNRVSSQQAGACLSDASRLVR